MELGKCPVCHGQVTTSEIEEKKLRDFEAYINMIRTTSYRYGKVWQEVSCSDEGMWVKLGKAVITSLPEGDGQGFVKYLEGNTSVASIYTKTPDEAVELWLKRKEKRGQKLNTK